MAQVVVKRFFGKKRGSRNMRSDKLGGASLGLFFFVFFVFGCAGLGLVLRDLTIPDWRANYAFLPADCTVLDTRLDKVETATSLNCRPEVKIEYTIDGTLHRIWTFDILQMYTTDQAWCRGALEAFHAGQQRTCWYDPQNPDRAIVVRGHRWFAWLSLVLPISFLAMGSGGLVYTLLNWNKSTERRAVWARKAAELDPLETMLDANASFPHVPGYTHLTNSPGTTLRFRLPPAAPSWPLISMVAAALGWNLVVGALALIAVRRVLLGRPDWALLAILVLLLAIGVGLVVAAVRRTWGAMAIGSTIVEIDQHPLYPGGTYQLFIKQHARAPLSSFQISLACDELVRYLQGTDLRIARQRVAELPLSTDEASTIAKGSSQSIRIRFAVPAHAMHSFQADHNRIMWKLVVEGALANGQSFERHYPVSVYPSGAQHSGQSRLATRSSQA
ncbi:MAG TPA: DUF3592 domain-containing protein [Pirellulales bacterium]|nr:DUF3592 domain-containing protein [Pirellulales bacterium]